MSRLDSTRLDLNRPFKEYRLTTARRAAPTAAQHCCRMRSEAMRSEAMGVVCVNVNVSECEKKETLDTAIYRCDRNLN